MLITEKKLRLIIREELLSEQGVDLEVDFDGDSNFVPDVVSVRTSQPKPIGKGVRTNALIISVWSYLSPRLPKGAYMSSALRTQAEQDRLICRFADKRGIECNVNDSKSLDNAVTQLQQGGVAIGRRVSTKRQSHGAGDTFDISGASLSKIKKAVEDVTNDPSIPVRFAEFGPTSPPYSLLEPKNNAVHVIIEPTGFKAAAIRDD